MEARWARESTKSFAIRQPKRVEKTITFYGHTVVAVESVKADLPTFQIEPRGYMDQKLCRLTNDTKEMLRGVEDFRCYRVTSSASESRVEQVFTPEVREYLKQKKWHVESGLHHLLVYQHNKVLPNTQFANFTEEVIKLYHLLAAARTGRTEPRDQIMVGDDGRLRLTKV